MTGSEPEGDAEIVTSCVGTVASQALSSALSTSSTTAKSAASALSAIWTRTVAAIGSSVKATWRSACQGAEVIWTAESPTEMQGRGPGRNSPRANAATIINGTAEAKILKRNMTRYSLNQAHNTPDLWLAEG